MSRSLQAITSSHRHIEPLPFSLFPYMGIAWWLADLHLR